MVLGNFEITNFSTPAPLASFIFRSISVSGVGIEPSQAGENRNKPLETVITIRGVKCISHEK